MARDKTDATIVRSAIELGHNMDIKIVAKGVSDDTTWAALKRLGRDYAQGYHLSPPFPAQEFEKWFRAREVPRRVIYLA